METKSRPGSVVPKEIEQLNPTVKQQLRQFSLRSDLVANSFRALRSGVSRQRSAVSEPVSQCLTGDAPDKWPAASRLRTGEPGLLPVAFPDLRPSSSGLRSRLNPDARLSRRVGIAPSGACHSLGLGPAVCVRPFFQCASIDGPIIGETGFYSPGLPAREVDGGTGVQTFRLPDHVTVSVSPLSPAVKATGLALIPICVEPVAIGSPRVKRASSNRPTPLKPVPRLLKVKPKTGG
jgi:hypothetical protein